MVDNRPERRKGGAVIEKNDGGTNTYRKADALFTKAEKIFLDVLEDAVGDQFTINGKTRLADIVTVDHISCQREKRIAFNKIKAKHIDYLLCNKKDKSLVCGIELNDSTHNRKDRQDRDIFVNDVFEEISLPLVMIKWQNNYSVDEVRQIIFNAIKYEQNEQNIKTEDIKIPESKNYKYKKINRYRKVSIISTIKSRFTFEVKLQLLVFAIIFVAMSVFTWTSSNVFKNFSESNRAKTQTGVQSKMQPTQIEPAPFKAPYEPQRKQMTDTANEMGNFRQAGPGGREAKRRVERQTIYSWINEKGNRVYSNTGFPEGRKYTDPRIDQ